MKEVKIQNLFWISFMLYLIAVVLFFGFLAISKDIDRNTVANGTYIIVCSESIGDSWYFKIPDKTSICPEYATHWKLYGERIKN